MPYQTIDVNRFLMTASYILMATAVLAQSSPQDVPQTVTSSITTTELVEYADLSPGQQQIIQVALQLTTMQLHYRYGSADPSQGGMDCSGTIHYLLKEPLGLKHVPRQANTIYRWVWLHSTFHAVNSQNPDGFEWKHLQPGDLLFWSGTYEVDRDPPVTHVMLYLGTLKSSGKRVMFGASSGRYYAGKPHHGVSVFNFNLPRKGSSARFLGYGPIPGLQALSPQPTGASALGETTAPLPSAHTESLHPPDSENPQD